MLSFVQDKTWRVGACNVRKNVNGKLYSLVYEHPVAMHIDPIEKKPLFHVKPGSKVLSFGTVGCNFKCAFCQNWDISQSKDVGREMMTPTQIVKLALEDGCEGIAYTYNEPIIFVEYVLETAKLAHEAGLINVYVSNGYETEEALQMLAPHIDAMNIDLKGFTDKFYLSLCKARLQPVLDTIRRAHELGIWIELTTLVIPGKNDSEKELQELSKFIVSVDPEIPWHISRFFLTIRYRIHLQLL